MLLNFEIEQGLQQCLDVRFTAVVDQTRHKKGRRAKPRNWFYILICGRFESKLLYVADFFKLLINHYLSVKRNKLHLAKIR